MRRKGSLQNDNPDVLFRNHLGDLGESEGKRPLYARLDYLTGGDGNSVLRTSLSAYFGAEDDLDDTLLQRLQNATILLAEADRIATGPISLSLSFAAIEALVCEKDELPVNKQIKRHLATLLVQDPEKRDRAQNVASKLYTIRCDVLHGNKVHGSSEASEAVRRIAAGVIRADVCWRENQLKVGGSTTWKELMDEVTAATRKPGIVAGVPDLSELIPDKVPS
jgi:hypothetical protein